MKANFEINSGSNRVKKMRCLETLEERINSCREFELKILEDPIVEQNNLKNNIITRNHKISLKIHWKTH